MASVSTDKDGRKRILFMAGDGKRRAIRLGKIPMRQADGIRLKVEQLVAASIGGQALDDETTRWLAERDDRFYNKFVKVGLVKQRANVGITTIAKLLDTFFAQLDVKPITKLGYQSTRKALEEQFGKQTPIGDITPLQADQWRSKMKADGLAEATIGKRVKLARQMFRQAVRWKLTPENPFTDVRAGSQVNKANQFFITREMAEKVLAACPNTEWRLIVALSRYGGLRCPSEHLALKWGDIDFEAGSIRVTCSKTERHEGRGERLIPMFPELRPIILEAFVAAEPGNEYVIANHRQSNVNLRTHMHRIIRKAGLTPWSRTFHNLRSTRQTELSEQFPAQVVCSWIGNTERVAMNHYLQTTDAHFKLALVSPKTRQCDAAQNPTQLGSNRVENPGNESESENLDIAQNTEEIAEIPVFCDISDEPEVAATGLEPVTRGL